MRSCRLHEGRLNTEVAQAAKEQRASMSTTQRQTLRTAENGPGVCVCGCSGLADCVDR